MYLDCAIGAPSAHSASIDLIGANPATGQPDFGVCQGSVVPGGAPLHLFIYAHLGDGVTEMQGTEFFVRERGSVGEDRNNIFVPVDQGGLGWSAISVPSPQVSATLGDPLLVTGTPPDTYRAAVVEFAACQRGDADAPPGYVRLYDVSISNSATGAGIPLDTYFWVSPGRPTAGAQNRAHLSLCDSPVYTNQCVPGGQFIVKPSTRTCAVATQPKAWSVVKELYRDATR